MKYKGELKGFPQEVVEKMLERQEEQGNKRDVSVFEDHNTASVAGGGFNWEYSIEGRLFWTQVIDDRNFGLFFDKYPNKENMNDDKDVTLAQYAEILEQLEEEIRADGSLHITLYGDGSGELNNGNVELLKFDSVAEFEQKANELMQNKQVPKNLAESIRDYIKKDGQATREKRVERLKALINKYDS